MTTKNHLPIIPRALRLGALACLLAGLPAFVPPGPALLPGDGTAASHADLGAPSVADQLSRLGTIELYGLHEGSDPHDETGLGRSDAHGPIGVMGEHMHAQGEWMLSFRAMHMHMEDMRNGMHELSPSEVFAKGYMVTPLQMDTDMFMFGGMWAPSDDVTLTAMLPWVRKSMDHMTMGGVKFNTASEGLGDLTLGSLIRVLDDGPHHLHWNLGLSLPTGSIREKDRTPASGGLDVKLPYPMQLGTGTFDLLPGATYTGKSEDCSWGAQALLRLPLEHENSQGYRYGTRGELSAWVARQLGRDVSGSVRMRYSHWNAIRGADSDLVPTMVPTANPAALSGERVDLLLGLNWIDAEAGPGGNRLALEFGVPVHQDLDGPQLGLDYVVTLGWQKAF